MGIRSWKYPSFGSVLKVLQFKSVQPASILIEINIILFTVYTYVGTVKNNYSDLGTNKVKATSNCMTSFQLQTSSIHASQLAKKQLFSLRRGQNIIIIFHICKLQ